MNRKTNIIGVSLSEPHIDEFAVNFLLCDILWPEVHYILMTHVTVPCSAHTLTQARPHDVMHSSKLLPKKGKSELHPKKTTEADHTHYIGSTVVSRKRAHGRCTLI